MKTINDHLDDLDRMIDSGHATKDAIRSQVAFIGREVAALQADYSRLAQGHANLQDAHHKLNAEYAAYKESVADATFDALKKDEDRYHKSIQSRLLNHKV